MNKKTLWITETAVMIALLVALQWATKPLGQFVTGSCVNLVLGVSVLVGGLLRFSAGHRPGVSAHCPHGGRRQHGAGGYPAPSGKP